MPDYIDHRLSALAQRLRARYPGVRIVSAELFDNYDGIQQNIRYQATLERLRECGLLSGKMEDPRCQLTPIGDGFFLCDRLDQESRDGLWDLMICTGSIPWERARIGTGKARQLLRQIAKGVKKAA